MTLRAILPAFNEDVPKVSIDIIRTRVNQVAVETKFNARSILERNIVFVFDHLDSDVISVQNKSKEILSQGFTNLQIQIFNEIYTEKHDSLTEVIKNSINYDWKSSFSGYHHDSSIK